MPILLTVPLIVTNTKPRERYNPAHNYQCIFYTVGMHYIYVVFLASLNTEKCPQFNLQFASTKVAFYKILMHFYS